MDINFKENCFNTTKTFDYIATCPRCSNQFKVKKNDRFTTCPRCEEKLTLISIQDIKEIK